MFNLDVDEFGLFDDIIPILSGQLMLIQIETTPLLTQLMFFESKRTFEPAYTGLW